VTADLYATTTAQQLEAREMQSNQKNGGVENGLMAMAIGFGACL
jgi:hypothetical protein